MEKFPYTQSSGLETMETINLDYRFTETEAVRAAMAVTKSSFKFIATMPWLGGILLFLGLILAFFQSKNLFYLSALLFFGLLFVSIPALTVWSAKRNFRKNPSANKTIRWTIAEKGLKNETEGVETKFMWDKLIDVEEVKSGFLLFPQPRLAHWIPKSAFRNDVELNSFRNVVRNNVIQSKGQNADSQDSGHCAALTRAQRRSPKKNE